ncbi:MAG: EAL domain-containing protein [Candidatus Manganitrophus sp.]|nr:MAG: EAL domain-containing protein [Candidatus Manganitrophus sp.]
MQAALRDGGLQPSDVEIELEITETLLHSIERSVEVLRRLRRLGIRLAIDHFGTGCSSLSLLKRLPVDTLKIDRTFVRNIPDDTDNKAIAAAIISMGHSLGLRVIAEGVETDGQLAFLRQQGCDEAQGHLLSEAVSAEAASRLLGRREPFKAA